MNQAKHCTVIIDRMEKETWEDHECTPRCNSTIKKEKKEKKDD